MNFIIKWRLITKFTIKTAQHQLKFVGVPDTGAHVKQQRGFVLCNSENMVVNMEGSDSAAQDFFSGPRGRSQKCGHILGLKEC